MGERRRRADQLAPLRQGPQVDKGVHPEDQPAGVGKQEKTEAWELGGLPAFFPVVIPNIVLLGIYRVAASDTLEFCVIKLMFPQDRT